MNQALVGYGKEGSQAYSLYYRHSNHVGPVGLVLGGLGGLAAGLFAAVIYAYAIVYIPIIYANLACVACFGALLGYLPARIMRWGKVRCIPVVLAVVAIVTVAAYCFHWIVWVYALLDREPNGIPFDLLMGHPRAVISIIGNVYQHGTWGMTSGEPVSGIVLAIVWLVEAGMIFGVAPFVAHLSQAASPFCEACNVWCPDGMPIRTVGVGGSGALRERMEARDWSFLDQLGSAGSQNWILITHHGCRVCRKFHTFSAEFVSLSHDSRGRETVKKQTLLNKLIVGPEDVEAIRASRVEPQRDAAVDRAAEALQDAQVPAENPIADGTAGENKLEAASQASPADDAGGRIGI